MHRAASEGRAGLTLLEVAIVVAIVALLAAIAVPAAGAGDEQALELAEVHVRDALGRARALARSQRSPHAVVFDSGGDRLALVDASGVIAIDPLTRRPDVIDFAGPDGPRRIDVVDADFDGAGRAAIFDAQGVPLTGGTLVLRRGGVTHTLQLQAATGQLVLVGS